MAIDSWFGLPPWAKADLEYAELSKKPANYDRSASDKDLGSVKPADLKKKNLAYAKASYAFMVKAKMAGANLKEADLRSAEMIEADLRGAKLIKADLSNAKVQSADLRGADLSNAKLQGANLKGADLRCAILTNSRFDKAIRYSDTGLNYAKLPQEYESKGIKSYSKIKCEEILVNDTK